MQTVEIKLELPDDVAQNAQAEGLLNAVSIRAMIEREIRRCAARNLLAVADEIRKAGLPELTPEEVQAEIDDYRAEKRQTRADRR